MPAEEGRALHDAVTRAVAAVPGRPVIEIGSYCGLSTLWLAAAARANGVVLVTVDHHRGSEEIQPGWEHHDPEVVDPRTGRMDTLPFLRRTLEDAGLEDDVVVVVGRSAAVGALMAATVGAAMVFIDGGHGDDLARIDHDVWSPAVAPGGLLAIHDVHPDPATGGRPPFERIYRPALASGLFEEVAAVGTLRLLRRC
ncbi:MAG: class I SAM-dependent methyltransferase [Ilumatobacteraceae bacterium]